MFIGMGLMRLIGSTDLTLAESLPRFRLTNAGVSGCLRK